ncbi:MAG: nucleotidyltransferase family protein [Deltaproteobacteria bacterium]|nr:nucleotidyltransferase family protein [Candidatus Zymogenaceae bacterium]
MADDGKTDLYTTYDALILAGDGKGSREVFNENKALLTIKGRPTIGYIIEALKNSRHIRDIYIVGPKDRLESALAGDSSLTGGGNVVILEQWNNLIENALKGYLSTIPGHTVGTDPDSYLNTPFADKKVLALSCDMPLLTPYEIDEFLEGVEPDTYDYQAGITSDETLHHYYPDRRKKRKGIRHAYFHFKEENYRQNNMHFGALLRLRNKIYIEKMYEYRHQREWKDIIKLVVEILRTEKGSYKALYYFALFQMCMSFTSKGLYPLTNLFRRLIHLSDVERLIGIILGTRFKTVETHYGGGALDIDNEAEFEAIRENFEDWAAYQRRLSEKNVKET